MGAAPEKVTVSICARAARCRHYYTCAYQKEHMKNKIGLRPTRSRVDCYHNTLGYCDRMKCRSYGKKIGAKITLTVRRKT